MTNDLATSILAYETSLRDSLAWGGLREQDHRDDLAEKHAKMADGAFPFLRATYWRWCELVVQPEQNLERLLALAPVLSVGDVHVENFGTWRDDEGRLVFGVNDFDEAAAMPWPLDLLRLATSALLGAHQAGRKLEPDVAAGLVLGGYAAGIAAPAPHVLDDREALRGALEVVEQKARRKFWEKEEERAQAKPVAMAELPPRFAARLAGAFPDGAEIGMPYARQAGLGSLGRPRYAAIAQYRGGKAVREVKALLPSAWTRVTAPSWQPNRTAEAALGRHRSPDPWFTVALDVACRRLSPNNRKIELPKKKDEEPLPIAPMMLEAMGRDLAAVHTATPDAKARIPGELQQLGKPGWLAEAAERMAGVTTAEQAAFALRSQQDNAASP